MLIAFLMAAAAATVAQKTPVPASAYVTPVVVTAEDPTVRFQGNGSSIKFDPSCRDYNLDTVANDPACAARVAKRELQPAFAIGIHTLMELPSRRDDALALLNNLVLATDHPAIHYLLGNYWSTGQLSPPDYPLARRHLEAAAKGGNPIAKDLLAGMLVDGKGGPRDIPMAISLFEQAAANGVPVAGHNLAMLYLQGRYFPRDAARGETWLKAAAQAGDEQSTKLVPMVAIDGKSSNFQLMPSPDPAMVKVENYGIFDNPDIPPGFGFDKDFQKIYYAPYSDPAVLKRLKSDTNNLPTPYLYELARRQAGTDPAASIRSYIVARTRMTYDALRCSDRSALEAVYAWDRLMAGQLRYLFTPAYLNRETVDAALALEASMPAGNEPWWVCRSGMAQMTAAMGGKAGPLPLKAASEWPALREVARSTTAKLVPSS